MLPELWGTLPEREATSEQLPVENSDAKILRELCGKLRAKPANLQRILEVNPCCHVFMGVFQEFGVGSIFSPASSLFVL